MANSDAWLFVLPIASTIDGAAEVDGELLLLLVVVEVLLLSALSDTATTASAKLALPAFPLSGAITRLLFSLIASVMAVLFSLAKSN